MPKKHPLHRHYVAAPIMAALLLAVTLFDHTVPAGAMVAGEEGTMTASDREEKFSTPAGIAGILSSGSEITLLEGGTRVRLRSGSLIMRAEERATLEGDLGVSVHIRAGSVLMLKDDQSVTVVALASAVLIEREEQLWILPEGYQLRLTVSGKAERLDIPSDWFQEHRAEADALTPVQPLNALSESPEDVLFAAKDSSDSSLALLTALHFATLADRMTGSGASMVTEILSSDSRIADDLPFVVPALAASTLKPLPPDLLAVWAQATIHFATLDPSGTVAMLHQTIPGLPASYDEAGYPKQAILWRAAITEVSDVLLSIFTGSERAQLAADTATALRSGLVTEMQMSNSAHSSASPVTARYTSDQVLSMTHSMLMAHDVLFSATTTVEIAEDNSDCSHVSNIFIAEQGRDVPYEFTYCPVNQMLMAITRNAVRLPNDVTVEKFFR